MALQPTEIKTVVTLPIRKEEHVDFLRSMFDGTRGQPIKINRHELMGRLIFGLRKYSSNPNRQIIPDGYVTVDIEFPNIEFSTCNKHFCYYTIEDIQQINDVLSALFDIYFYHYFIDEDSIETLKKMPEFEGVEITREMLVDSFVFGMGIVDTSRANETVKKREYRRQMIEDNRKRRKFYIKDYNFRQKLFLLKYNNLKKMIL